MDLSSHFEHNPLIDVAACKVSFSSSNAIYLIAVYIPPAFSHEQYADFFSTLASLDFLYDNRCLIIGDFNLTEYSTLAQSESSPKSLSSLLDFLHMSEFQQYNNIINSNARILDLVLSSFHVTVASPWHVMLPEDAHHNSILVQFPIRITKSKNQARSFESSFYNFKKANFPGLYNAFLHTDWSNLEVITDVDTAVSYFYEVLRNTLDAHVPKTTKYKSHFPKWYNRNIIGLIARKDRARTLYKRFNDEKSYAKFRELRRKLKDAIEFAYEKFCRDSESNIREDPKKLWNFVKSKRRQGRIPQELYLNDQKFSSPLDISQGFADFFASVFSSCASNDSKSSTNSSRLGSGFFISEKSVFSELKTSKNSCLAGPDLVPSFLLKDCALVFSYPLFVIFNLALKLNTFPSLWKEANVIPVFKSGKKQLITNYRPIVILNNFSKIFESCVYTLIYNTVSSQICGEQHGFVSGRSTCTNLFLVTQFIANNMDEKLQTDVIYADFSKAFDKVNHSKLLDKLYTIGLSMDIVLFLKSYLSNRDCRVVVGGCKSNSFCPMSGVPQGSSLGPLLFVLFINDIVKYLTCPCLLYADDLKIFHTIRTSYNSYELQMDLDRLAAWCTENLLELNLNKCVVMSYSSSNSVLLTNYLISGHILQRPVSVKDLGITFTEKLQFTNHIDNILTSANISLGFIFRNFRDFGINALLLLYQFLVISRLGYCCVIWNPYQDYVKKSIENIQRKFLKFLFYKSEGTTPPVDITNTELRTKFNICSLESRRHSALQKFLYKVITNGYNTPDILQQIDFKVPRVSARFHSNTFHLPTPRANVKKFSPLYQICDSYHSIQNETDIFCCNVRDFST